MGEMYHSLETGVISIYAKYLMNGGVILCISLNAYWVQARICSFMFQSQKNKA